MISLPFLKPKKYALISLIHKDSKESVGWLKREIIDMGGKEYVRSLDGLLVDLSETKHRRI